MKKSMFAVLIALLMVVCSSPGRGAIPQLINYQGRLANSSGTPLTGTYSVAFKIYKIVEGSPAEIWTETQNVSAESGIFSVLLGSVAPIGLDVFDGGERYLGINVAGDGEMTPRHRLVSVANAYKAYDSDNLGGQPPSYYIGAAGGGSVTLGPTTQQATASATAVWVKGATTGVSGEGATNGVYGRVTGAGSYGVLGCMDDGEPYGVLSSGDLKVTGQIKSAQSHGASPLTVVSSTCVTNLNADLLDGIDSSGLIKLGPASEQTTAADNAVAVETTSDTGTAVLARASGNGEIYGVMGISHSYSGAGVSGLCGVFPGLTNIGIVGGGSYGVYAAYDVLDTNNNKAWLAVSGYGVSAEGSSYGVFGKTSTVNGYGLYGSFATNRYGYLGSMNYGGYAQYDANHYAILGASDKGGYFKAGTPTTDDLIQYGIYCTSEARAVNNYGVATFAHGYGAAHSYALSATVKGETGCDGSLYAVRGEVQGSTTGTYKWAGFFTGGDGLYASLLSVDELEPLTYNTIGGHTATKCISSKDLFISGTLEVDGPSYFDGGYSDLAELILVTGPREAGDILVVDPDNDEKGVRSSTAYQRSVIGVVSEKPSMLISGGLNEPEASPLALCGRVNVKVTSENGAIKRGDLLTTSSTPGCAMKATQPGFIIGRAMQNFDGPAGQIGRIKTFVNVSWFGGTQ